MVLLILLIVYRNPVTMLMPLITIGVTVATAQGVVAGFANWAWELPARRLYS